MSRLRTATVYIVRTVSPTVDPEAIAEQMTSALASAVPDRWEMGRPSIDVRTVTLFFEAFEGGTDIVVSSGPYDGVSVSSTTAEEPSGEPAGSTGIAAFKAHVRAPRPISTEELQGFRDAVRSAFSTIGMGGIRTSVTHGTQSIPGDFGVPPTPPLPGAETNFLLVAGVAAAGALFLSVVGARRRDEPEPQMAGLAGDDESHVAAAHKLLESGRKQASGVIADIRRFDRIPRSQRATECRENAEILSDAQEEIFAGHQVIRTMSNPNMPEAREIAAALDKVAARIESARKQFNRQCFPGDHG